MEIEINTVQLIYNCKSNNIYNYLKMYLLLIISCLLEKVLLYITINPTLTIKLVLFSFLYSTKGARVKK